MLASVVMTGFHGCVYFGSYTSMKVVAHAHVLSSLTGNSLSGSDRKDADISRTNLFTCTSLVHLELV